MIDIKKKIKMALAFANMSEAELARRLGSTPQAFNKRVRTGKFTSEELDGMATVLGAEFVCAFRFPDGTEI